MTSKLIAELHSAGLTNKKIGYLLQQYGGKARSEGTVRSWAMRKGEPRISDYNALGRLHAATFLVISTVNLVGIVSHGTIVENCVES